MKTNAENATQADSTMPAGRSNGDETETVLVGGSAVMEEIRSAILLVAKSPTPVLIGGESGTGKEVVARLIHTESNRSDKPFIAVNCGALPKEVIENELFGHEKGAFTGALPKKAGCFELAENGTLFFDELAEMHPDTQVKLLRAIELKSFRRLGGNEEIHVDVRMLAATNKDIPSALKSRRLREDLYYRFSVIEIYLPPLRDRKEDVPLLVDRFLATFARKYNKPPQEFSQEALDKLAGFDWPGNVRELKNVIERAVVICPDVTIGSKYLPERITGRAVSRCQISIPLGTSMRDAERTIILQTLASVGGNKSHAARILGLSRRALLYKVQQYNQTAV
ncbi:MAG TPA: sigma-54 dependent transcriptional regulator [Bacteroidota bacterium]|nr:sigma-54 dependent transcriptional regulator [Bacteroidota bacterium]